MAQQLSAALSPWRLTSLCRMLTGILVLVRCRVQARWQVQSMIWAPLNLALLMASNVVTPSI